LSARAVAAANPDVVLADAWAAFLATKEVLTFDGTHPNAAGHALIATTILRAWGVEV
jgi:lysophospholipase L1-like esterase